MPEEDQEEICPGDSGGALASTEDSKYVIIGVVSSKLTTHPSRPCDSYYPGIYVRVDNPNIFDFIKSKAFRSKNSLIIPNIEPEPPIQCAERGCPVGLFPDEEPNYEQKFKDSMEAIRSFLA